MLTSCTLFGDNFPFITRITNLKVVHKTINRTYIMKAASIAAKKKHTLNRFKNFLKFLDFKNYYYKKM